MAILSFCGIDVSKDRLDVVVLPEGRFCSVSNDAAGWAVILSRADEVIVPESHMILRRSCERDHQYW